METGLCCLQKISGDAYYAKYGRGEEIKRLPYLNPDMSRTHRKVATTKQF